MQNKGQQGSRSEGVGQSRLMAYTKMNRFLSSFIEKVCWTTVGGQGESAGEGEGRVLVKGKGRVLVKGKGRVLVKGKGKVLVKGKGRVLVKGKGECW